MSSFTEYDGKLLIWFPNIEIGINWPLGIT